MRVEAAKLNINKTSVKRFFVKIAAGFSIIIKFLWDTGGMETSHQKSCKAIHEYLYCEYH